MKGAALGRYSKSSGWPISRNLWTVYIRLGELFRERGNEIVGKDSGTKEVNGVVGVGGECYQRILYEIRKELTKIFINVLAFLCPLGNI